MDNTDGILEAHCRTPESACSIPRAATVDPVRVVADVHVHLYGVFDRSRALVRLSTNLARCGPHADVRVGFLTERYDEQALAAVATGLPGWSAEELERGLWHLRHERAPDLYLVAGRQVATSERLEVLGLGLHGRVEEGRTVEETVRTVRDAGGLPVLTWAFGKWAGTRGRMVRTLLQRMGPGDVLLGDTSLRPAEWPEGALLRRARARGFVVLAGSDALPMASEERYLGRYGCMWSVPEGKTISWVSLRAWLVKPGRTVRTVGRRCGFLTAAWRLMRYQFKARGASGK